MFSYSDNLVSEKKYIYTCEEKRKGKETSKDSKEFY